MFGGGVDVNQPGWSYEQFIEQRGYPLRRPNVHARSTQQPAIQQIAATVRNDHGKSWVPCLNPLDDRLTGQRRLLIGHQEIVPSVIMGTMPGIEKDDRVVRPGRTIVKSFEQLPAHVSQIIANVRTSPFDTSIFMEVMILPAVHDQLIFRHVCEECVEYEPRIRASRQSNPTCIATITSFKKRQLGLSSWRA